MLYKRRISLFQRASYANSCLLSKVWYLSHIYPLPGSYALDINRAVFRYIWCGRYEPIRRTTVFKPKSEGGLGLINCQIKSRILIVNSFLKCYANNEYENPLMIFYCFLKLNTVIQKNFSVHEAATVSTPYYQAIISTLNNFLQVSTFPVLNNQKIYLQLMSKEKPVVETVYPLFNWKKIWDNLCSLQINTFDKDIIYKHLHVSLATNSKLSRMDITNTSTCNLCNDDREQTALHILYECSYIAPFYQWFLIVLMYLFNFKPSSNIRFLYFDSFYINSHQRNICNMFLSMYITTVWRTRKENLRIGILKQQFIKRVIGNFEIRKQIPRQNIEKKYGPYSNKLNFQELNNLM